MRFAHYDGRLALVWPLGLIAAVVLALPLGGCDGGGDNAQGGDLPMNAEGGGGEGSEAAQAGNSAPATRPATAPSATRPSTQAAQAASGESPGPGEASDKLTGTWVAENVSTSAGDVKIRLQFSEVGRAKLVAMSELPLVGEVRNMTSPYEVKSGAIHAPQIRGGVTMPFHFEGDTLVLEYKPGQTVRFSKSSEEDPKGQ